MTDVEADALSTAQSWMEAGFDVVLATVVKTWGSAPRPAGSTMAVRGDGQFVGSVSGGCVEAAVIQEAHAAILDRKPRRLEYGVSDDQAWSVGLACGGRIEVFVEPVG